MGQESTALPFPLSFACLVDAQGHRLSSHISTVLDLAPRQEVSILLGLHPQ